MVLNRQSYFQEPAMVKDDERTKLCLTIQSFIYFYNT